nr:unnamed protein product [Digitaria exilis]
MGDKETTATPNKDLKDRAHLRRIRWAEAGIRLGSGASPVREAALAAALRSDEGALDRRKDLAAAAAAAAAISAVLLVLVVAGRGCRRTGGGGSLGSS